MAKKVTIELTETQARTVLQAVEEWFRLRMGQPSDLANGLAFLGYKRDKDHPEKFDAAIQKRDSIDAVLKAMFNIAFPYYGMPKEIEPEVHIASDIWSTLRYELSEKTERTPTPFQMGTEPLPKISVMEELGDASADWQGE